MNNPELHLVKAAFFWQFKTAMENCGISSDYYFKKFNLPTEVSDPESLLPLKPFFHLINIVAISENIPDFGSLVAQTTPWHKVLSLGPLINNSENLRNLLEKFCEIASSQSSLVCFNLIDEDSHFYFSYTDTPIFKGDIQMELYRITSMIQLVQLAAGVEWRPDYIRLNMPCSPAVNACSLLTKSEIIFSQADSAISVHGDLLQLPVQMGIPAGLKKAHNNHADLDKEFVNSICQIVNTYTQTQDISIEEVSDIAEMTVRTLQRRLKSNNLKFNELLNQARLTNAKERLQNTQMPIKEVANSLGYSDTAHFTRAFKRWTGMTPSKFRSAQT